MLRLVAASRHTVRAVIVTVIAVGLLLPAALPASAAGRMSILQGRSAVEIDGVRYRVRLSVTKLGRQEFIDISVGRAVDPDGDGVLRSKQAHLWSFISYGRAVSVARDARSAGVHTGEQFAPHAELDLGFMATDDPDVRCAGTQRTAHGKLRGTLSLAAAGGLEDIALSRMRATLETTESPGCGASDTPPPWLCPPRMEMISGMTRTTSMISAMRRRGASKALLTADTSRFLDLEDPEAFGIFQRSVTATVPSSHVRLSDDLGRGVMRGAPGLFIRGRAEFAGSGAVDTESGDCPDNKEWVTTMRGGRITGTLRADHLAGRDFDLEGRRLFGSAGTFAVRRA